MGAYFIGLPPRLRNNCAEPVYNFKSDARGSDACTFKEWYLDKIIDSAASAEQAVEQKCKSRCHDYVWKIDNSLEESLSLYLKTKVSEPYCKDKRDNDLWDKSYDPHDDRIPERLEKVTS